MSDCGISLRFKGAYWSTFNDKKNLLGINCYTETTDETNFQMGSEIGREGRMNE